MEATHLITITDLTASAEQPTPHYLVRKVTVVDGQIARIADDEHMIIIYFDLWGDKAVGFALEAAMAFIRDGLCDRTVTIESTTATGTPFRVTVRPLKLGEEAEIPGTFSEVDNAR